MIADVTVATVIGVAVAAAIADAVTAAVHRADAVTSAVAVADAVVIAVAATSAEAVTTAVLVDIVPVVATGTAVAALGQNCVRFRHWEPKSSFEKMRHRSFLPWRVNNAA